MKKISITLITIGLVSLILYTILSINNDYLTYKDRNCVVVDKLEQMSNRRSTHSDFILILKEERGIIFDIIVSPSTYSQSKVGQKIIFNLRQFDIKQTPKENIYLFGYILLLSIGISFLIVGIFVRIFVYSYQHDIGFYESNI